MSHSKDPSIPYFSLVSVLRSIVGRQGRRQPAEEGKGYLISFNQKTTQNIVNEATLAQRLCILADETGNTEGSTQADLAVSVAVLKLEQSNSPTHDYE